MNRLHKWWMEFLGWKIYPPTPEGYQDCLDYIRIHAIKNHRILVTHKYTAVKEI